MRDTAAPQCQDLTWSDILAIDNRYGEAGGGLGQLAGLVEGGLGGVGVEDGSDGLPIDDRGGEVGRSLSSAERIVGTGGSGDTSGQLGPGGGHTEQSS